MPNWKNIVSSSNAKQYRWPAGWQTREQVAEELECSRERVSDVLAPAIEQGLVERKSFPVWDQTTRRKIMVTGYREVSRAERQERASEPKKSEEPRLAKRPLEGSKIRRRRGSGKVGILSREGKRWKITWPHRPPTYPSKNSLEKELEIL